MPGPCEFGAPGRGAPVSSGARRKRGRGRGQDPRRGRGERREVRDPEDEVAFVGDGGEGVNDALLGQGFVLADVGVAESGQEAAEGIDGHVVGVEVDVGGVEVGGSGGEDRGLKGRERHTGDSAGRRRRGARR